MKRLEWADEHGVKYIGMDGGVVEPGDKLVSSKLRDLRQKGFFVGGVEFTEDAPPADWPEILALAERATKCEQNNPQAPIITQSCFRQINDEQPELNISHKLDLSGPLRTLPDGQKLWDKERLTFIYARTTPSEATVWFSAYNLSGQLIRSYKARTPGGLPQEDVPMDTDEAERIAAQELQYWRGWKKEPLTPVK